jgi:heme/copper-type cytochrome/quinol oxidase subunit 3
MTATATRPPLRLVSTWLVLGSAFAIAAFVLWSIWWPHSDMRQIWVNAATVLALVVGLGSLTWALARVDRRDRRRLWAMTGTAVILGATVGFGVLDALSSSSR